MPLPRRVPNALLGACLLSCMLLAHAQPGAAPEPQGLPAGGGLDADQVTRLRYGAAEQSAAPAAAAPAVRAAAAPAPAAAPAAAPTPAPAPAPIAGAIATLWLERGAGANKAETVPVTFGQVFAPGALKRETRLGFVLADGKRIALQMDARAFHADGTVRHAILSGILPAPAAQPMALGLVKLNGDPRREIGRAHV